MENAVSLFVVNSRLTFFILDSSICDEQISLELLSESFLIDPVGLQQETLIKRLTPCSFNNGLGCNLPDKLRFRQI
jgi:hypothetical protein